MKHLATKRFWKCYDALPIATRQLSDKTFVLIKETPNHPSINFKKVGKLYSARIDSSYRALALKEKDNYIWLWIGNHDEYEKLINRM